MKTVLAEGRMKFKNVFLKILKLFELGIFRSSLFHSITAEEIMLCFEKRNIISVLCVVYTHRSGNNIELILWAFVSKSVKKSIQNPVRSSFFKGLQCNPLYSFSLDVPLIAPVIANAACGCIE